jgi:P2-like prophage tail protein X
MSDPSRSEAITVKGDFISVDLLAWRKFKDHRNGFVERVLDTNPGLADLGPILPVGTKVVIPLDAPELKPAERPVVRLWD